MNLRFIASIMLMTALALPAFANGKLSPVETPAAELETGYKDKLVAFILKHPELPQQQIMLKKVLESDKGAAEVLKSLPDSARKEILG